MSLTEDYLELVAGFRRLTNVPALAGLFLPALQHHPEFVDEFGFVFLEDGSVGPFYVSLVGTLPELWQRFPEPARARGNALELAAELESEYGPARAVALGAFNALSQHLMRRAKFRPSKRGEASGPVPRAGETVGMVGYFCPIIDRLRARDVSVRVLEHLPERVPSREGVERVTAPAALGDCRIVICTASTLINDTLAEILDACPGAESFEVIGPSASGLPDPLFSRGVRKVGGILYDDTSALQSALAAGVNWGQTGTKYEMTAELYPGFPALLERARRGA